MSDYYERVAATHTDGSPLFATASDSNAQEETARLIERTWGPHLKVKEFGKLSPIDYYAERHGRLAAVIEIKSRSHDSTKFATVFLNVRKWIAMQLASIGLGVPAFFFACFTDKVLYVDVSGVDATQHRIGGAARFVKSRSDVEPVIEVSVEKMSVLGERQPS